MAFPWEVLPAVVGLFSKSKVPKPPAWQDQMGQQMAALYQVYAPTVASRLEALSRPNPNSLFMQGLRRQITQQTAAGQRALNYALGQRGLLTPRVVAGANAAYQAYANALANQAVQQGLLQEEQLARQALSQLAQYASGQGVAGGQLGLALMQQMLGQYQVQQAQDEATAQLMGLLLSNLFRKKPASTAPAVNPASLNLGLQQLPGWPLWRWTPPS